MPVSAMLFTLITISGGPAGRGVRALALDELREASAKADRRYQKLLVVDEP